MDSKFNINEGDFLKLPFEFEEDERVSIMGKALVLWYSMKSISEEEIEKLRSASFEFGVVGGLGIMIFGCKIGKKSPWNLFEYQYQYSKYLSEIEHDMFFEPAIEELQDNEPLLLRVYIANAQTQQIVFKKIFRLSDEVKQEVISSFKRQKYLPIPIIKSNAQEDNVEYFEHIRLYLEKQNPKRIVNNLIKCFGVPI